MLSDGDHEATFIEVKFNSKKHLIVGFIYLHSSSKIPIKEFADDHLEPILNKISLKDKECIIMGDMNINLLKINTNSAYDYFFNTFLTNNDSTFVLQPTRLKSKTLLIDNFYFNSLEHDSFSGNPLVKISDHLIQHLISNQL